MIRLQCTRLNLHGMDYTPVDTVVVDDDTEDLIDDVTADNASDHRNFQNHRRRTVALDRNALSYPYSSTLHTLRSNPRTFSELEGLLCSHQDELSSLSKIRIFRSRMSHK